MKEKYSIGEVSRIMGISTQTLRYYSSIDLLTPEFINPDTGYRYYSPRQFHFIDRIRYLQKLGMSLDEIKEILIHNDINLLIAKLGALEQSCEEEIRRVNNTLDTIKWYKDYYISSEDTEDRKQYSVKHFKRRYMVAVAIGEDEDRDSYHLRLTALRNEPKMQDLPYMRQYSYIIDYDALLSDKLERKYLGMFIKSSADFNSPDIIEIPEGDYYCFRSRILSEGWNSYLIRMFFTEDKPKPSLVLATEFEDNLKEYHKCPYEVQIKIE